MTEVSLTHAQRKQKHRKTPGTYVLSGFYRTHTREETRRVSSSTSWTVIHSDWETVVHMHAALSVIHAAARRSVCVQAASAGESMPPPHTHPCLLNSWELSSKHTCTLQSQTVAVVLIKPGSGSRFGTTARGAVVCLWLIRLLSCGRQKEYYEANWSLAPSMLYLFLRITAVRGRIWINTVWRYILKRLAETDNLIFFSCFHWAKHYHKFFYSSPWANYNKVWWIFLKRVCGVIGTVTLLWFWHF